MNISPSNGTRFAAFPATGYFSISCQRSTSCLAEHRSPTPPAARSDRRRSPLLPEHSELPGIARGLGEAEVAEGVRGQQAAARGALNEALLDQERLDDLLDRIARLRERRGNGLDPDRAAAVVERDGR